METVVAEKMEALVHLGMLNSRMKDFYDIWFLARTFSFDLRILSAALHVTFDRRKTRLDPDGLLTLLVELSDDDAKRTQWRAFLRKSNLEAPDDFAIVNDAIRGFLITPASAGRETADSWPPGGPWQRQRHNRRRRKGGGGRLRDPFGETGARHRRVRTTARGELAIARARQSAGSVLGRAKGRRAKPIGTLSSVARHGADPHRNSDD
jgi:hypothetical protein